MNNLYKELLIEGEIFDDVRADFNVVLQKLIHNMVEKGSAEGSISIKLNVGISRRSIVDYENGNPNGTRQVLDPQFAHSVTSVMKIQDKANGTKTFVGEEMVWDPETEQFVMTPIKNTAQRSIFDDDLVGDIIDADYRQVDEEPVGIEGPTVGQISGPTVDVETGEIFDPLDNDFDSDEKDPDW